MSFTHIVGWICHLHTCFIIFRYFETYGFYSKKLFHVSNSIVSFDIKRAQICWILLQQQQKQERGTGSLPKSAESYCNKNKKEELEACPNLLNLIASTTKTRKRNWKRDDKIVAKWCSSTFEAWILLLNCNNRYNQLSRNGKQCIRQGLLVSLIT